MLKHKETIFFGLSLRQFACSAVAVGLAVGTYLLISPTLGKEPASWLCILAAAPFAIAGFFSYNGMTFEQFVWAFLKSEVFYAGCRPFVGQSIHYRLMNRKGCKDFD